jgi:hypothetical protein
LIYEIKLDLPIVAFSGFSPGRHRLPSDVNQCNAPPALIQANFGTVAVFFVIERTV